MRAPASTRTSRRNSGGNILATNPIARPALAFTRENSVPAPPLRTRLFQLALERVGAEEGRRFYTLRRATRKDRSVGHPVIFVVGFLS